MSACLSLTVGQCAHLSGEEFDTGRSLCRGQVTCEDDEKWMEATVTPAALSLDCRCPANCDRFNDAGPDPVPRSHTVTIIIITVLLLLLLHYYYYYAHSETLSLGQAKRKLFRLLPQISENRRLAAEAKLLSFPVLFNMITFCLWHRCC